MSTVNGPAVSTIGHSAYWGDTTGTQLNDAAGWYNVIVFGAIANDSSKAAGNYTAIQSAIAAAAAAGGGTVYFPAGQYWVSQTLTISAAQGGITLQGDNPNASTIMANFATTDVLDVAGYGAIIQGLNFEYNSGALRTSGYYLSLSGQASVARDLNFNGTFGGISLTGNQQTVANISMRNFAPNATGIFVSSGGAPIRLTNVTMDGSTSTPTAGIQVVNSSDINITDCDIDSMGTALLINPGSGQSVSNVHSVNTYYDAGPAGSHHVTGVMANPSGTGTVVNLTFLGCWASGHTASGFTFENSGTGSVTGIELVACQAIGNGGAGVALGSGSNISAININGGIFCGNGYGIYVNPGVTDFVIQGIRAGNYTGGPNGFGIVVGSGASNRYLITNNLLHGNTTGAISDAGTGTSKFVGGATGAGANLQ